MRYRVYVDWSTLKNGYYEFNAINKDDAILEAKERMADGVFPDTDDCGEIVSTNVLNVEGIPEPKTEELTKFSVEGNFTVNVVLDVVAHDDKEAMKLAEQMARSYTDNTTNMVGVECDWGSCEDVDSTEKVSVFDVSAEPIEISCVTELGLAKLKFEESEK